MMRHGVCNMADALCYMIDCQIATFWDAFHRKSSSKSTIQRHFKITMKAVLDLRLYHTQKDSVHLTDHNDMYDILRDFKEMCDQVMKDRKDIYDELVRTNSWWSPLCHEVTRPN